MIKEIIKFGMIAAIMYGLYKLISIWPVESSIIIGGLLVCLIIYWLIKLE